MLPRHVYRRGRTLYAWYRDRNGIVVKRSCDTADPQVAATKLAQWERDEGNPVAALRRDAKLGDAFDLLFADRQALVAVGKRSADCMGFLDCHARPWLLFAGRLIEFVGRQVPDPRGIDRERLIDLGRGAALATVDRHFVDGFVLHRRGQGIAESTIAKERTLLRNALRLAKRADMWAGDLEDMFPAFGAEYEPKRVFLTHEQADAMLAHLQPNRRAIAAFCLATGAEKRAVIRALRVDLEAVPLPLRGTKTKDRDRACPIVLPWQRALLDVAKTHADGIDGKAFTPWENSPRDLALACGKAGVPRVSLHGLRHIFGAWALDAGLSEGLVAKALGHRDTRMLELVYDTRDPQVIQRRAERETREKDLVRNGVA